MGVDRLPKGAGFVLQEALSRQPDSEAVVAADRRLTYAELDATADCAAASLHCIGVRRGDRVAISLPNASDIVVLFHAVMRLGAIWVGINTNLAAPEKRYILEDSGAMLLIGAAEELTTLRQIAALPSAAVCTPDAFTGSSPSPNGYPRPDDLFDAPAGIAYTSGTTGRPKGVVHSHRNLLLPGAVLVAERGYDSRLRRGDCAALTILNLQVTSTLLVAQAGGSQVVMNRVDSEGIADWIRRERVNSWFGVPTMLHGLARSDNVDPSDLASLEDIWTGGADLPESIREEFEEKFGRRVHATYGLTEVPTVVSIEPRSVPHRPGSSGTVLPHLTVSISTRNRLSGTEDVGEILIAGRAIGPWSKAYRPMLGYHNDPEGSREALADGFLHSGDVGTLDDDGSLSVRGRRKSLILRGGANVYPGEIERVILQIPGTVGAAVVGIPDDRLGQRVGGAVELAPDAAIDTEELDDHCRSSLARYKVPERWLIRPLPRNAMGKVIVSEVEAWFAGDDPPH
jgi:long-chain acyl-CoA synthetase